MWKLKEKRRRDLSFLFLSVKDRRDLVFFIFELTNFFFFWGVVNGKDSLPETVLENEMN